MEWLVCRTEVLKKHSPYAMLKSSMFPIVVDVEYTGRAHDYEAIVRKALDTVKENYVGMHDYIVIPLAFAHVVSSKPRQVYDVTVKPYGEECKAR